MEGVVGSSAEGLGADVEGAELEGVVGSSGKELGADVVAAKLDGVSGRSTGGIIVSSSSDDSVLMLLIGVSFSGLEGVVESSAGGIGSFSEDRVMLIGV